MNAKIGPQRRRWPQAMFQVVEEMLAETPVPSHKQMHERLRDSDLWDDLPTPRAIGDWIRRGWVTAAPSDAPWSIDDAERPEDIPLVLNFIRRASQNRHRSVPVSVATATWIVRIQRAYPALSDHPNLLSLLASRARQGAEGVRQVQSVLTYQPWTDTGARDLVHAVARGLAPESVLPIAGLDAYVGLGPEGLVRQLEDEAFERSMSVVKKEAEAKQ